MIVQLMLIGRPDNIIRNMASGALFIAIQTKIPKQYQQFFNFSTEQISAWLGQTSKRKVRKA